MRLRLLGQSLANRYGFLIFFLAVGCASIPPYNRSEFGSGFGDADLDCQSTRQEVLIRDSLVTPTMNDNGCAVVSGLWYDPYTGMETKDPRGLDIDHVVPLADAWRSGAWRWTKAMRVDYANDLSDSHLLAVSASENRKKGDKGPDEYMPPNEVFGCRYVHIYDDRKAVYNLSMTHAQKTKVDDVAAACTK